MARTGRGRVRVLQDIECRGCRVVFRPHWSGSVFCGNQCRLKYLHESRRTAGTFFDVVCWTQEEDDLLRRLWPDPKNTRAFITSKLPGRSIRSVGHRITFLGIRRDWKPRDGETQEEARNRWRVKRYSGKGNPFFGKHHTEETRKGLAESSSRTTCFRRLNKDPEFQRKRRKAWAKAAGCGQTKNKAETRLEKLIHEAATGRFEYVGDGSFIIDGLNPDWVCRKKKKIIELFGRAFHDPECCIWEVPERRTVAGRRAIFAKHGYQTLVIWDDSLKTVSAERLVLKIRRFMRR